MAKNSVYDWSSTAADNTDIGGISMQGTAAVSNFDNGFRTLMGQVADWTDQDTIASGGTTDLSTVPGMYVSVTGTTTITAFGTLKAGAIKYLKFAGILTLTHNATSLILPWGSNITTAAGDVGVFVSEGSGNWRCIGFRYIEAATTDEAIARYDGTSGRLQNSLVTIGDTGTQLNFSPSANSAVEIVNRATGGGIGLFVNGGATQPFIASADAIAGSITLSASGVVLGADLDASSYTIKADTVLAGKTAVDDTVSGLTLRPVGTIGATVTGGATFFAYRYGSDGDIHRFHRDASLVGSISVSTTATAYNTSSDYRLPWKEGHIPLANSGAVIDSLKPYYFPLVGHGGFIAHEFQTVSPSSVVGEKDAVDEDGEPIMQTMQPSSPDIMAHLVAEIQSLRKRVDALEVLHAG